MSAELAVGIVIAAFVLMVVILLGLTAVIAIDTVAAWPTKPRHRRSFGEQTWTRSTQQTDTVAIPVAGWSR